MKHLKLKILSKLAEEENTKLLIKTLYTPSEFPFDEKTIGIELLQQLNKYDTEEVKKFLAGLIWIRAKEILPEYECQALYNEKLAEYNLEQKLK